MKLKKLFAGVVAAAMIATMSFPAFADGDKITVESDNTFKIKKTYSVSENAVAPNEDFTFTVVKDSVSNSSITDAQFKKAGKYEVTVKSTANHTSTGTTDFVMQLPEYDKPGTFVYKLTEDDNAVAGVTYDDATYYLTVYAFQKAGSTSAGNDIECKVRLDKGGVKRDGEDGHKVDAINNSYTAAPLSVSKTVTGNMGDKSKYFDFTVTFKAPTGKKVKSTITVSGVGEANEVKVDNVALTGDKTITFGENETSKTVTFKLKNGETINFTNLPKELTYTVEEANYSSDGYKTFIGSDTDTEKRSTGDLTVNSGDAISVAYTNQNGETILDTGVILDNAPYILMLAVVAGGAMTLVIKKRREEE